MRFEWDMYHKYEDGSQSSSCEVKVYDANGNLLTGGEIEDHTLPAAKERDKKWGVNVPYGYDITGFGHWLSRSDFVEVFASHGLTKDDFGAFGYGGMGICKNEEYRSNPHEYVGTPKCTIHEVMDMMEEAFCKSLYFDYDAELAEFKKHLDERKARMDEAKEYLEERERVRESYTQDAIESNMEECLEIRD